MNRGRRGRAGPELDTRYAFEAFVGHAEPRLRIALTAVYGQAAGRDAAADALAYGWDHWDRVSVMEDPVGHLYRIGRASRRRRQESRWADVPLSETSDVAPGLPKVIASLSEKQRLAVVLVHAYGWTPAEVAGMVGTSASAVERDLAKGLARLGTSLGVDTHA